MQKVERLPYFSFYVADYLLDTGDLSLAEHGAYCLLMFRYYWNGGLTAADQYRGCRSPEDRAAVDSITQRFFHKDGERLVHNRIERELEKIGAFVEHQAKAGRASAAARAAIRQNKQKEPINGEHFALPEWVNKEKWTAWIAVRPARARTLNSQRSALAQLEKMRAKGFDANEIIERSLANGWQGLFEPDQRKGGLSLAEKNRLAGEEAQRRFEAEHGKG